MGSSKLTKQRRKAKEAAEAERRKTRHRVISKSKAKDVGIADADRKTLTKSQVSAVSANKTGRVGNKTEVLRANEQTTTQTPLPAKKQEPVTKKAVIELGKPKKEGFIEKTKRVATTAAKTGELETPFGTATPGKLIAGGAALAIGGAAIGGALGIEAGAAATASQAGRITLQKTAHQISLKTGNLMARGTVQTQRAIGKASHQIPKELNKIFNVRNRAVASRYASNTKSVGLTNLHLLTRGLQAAAVTFVAGAFGTYPFAAWAQQEVLSGLKINARDAREAGDFETAEEMIALRKEVSENPWWKDLPYKNVISQFTKFFEADKLAIRSEERLIAHARGELEFEGLSVGEQIEARDAQQKLEQEERDTKFEKSEEERIERQEERDKEFEKSEKDRIERQNERDRKFLDDQKTRDTKDRQDSAYFEVLRQMKEPFPNGTPIEDIDPEIVKAARESNLFFEGQF